MDATGGTTVGVGEALVADDWPDELDAEPELPVSGEPLAVEVTVVVDSEPLLQPASRTIMASTAMITDTGAFFRAPIIITAPIAG
jgi:hypothetical protein